MSHRIDYMPTNEEGFYEWQKPLFSGLEANARKYGINIGRNVITGIQGYTFTGLKMLKEDFEAKYAVAKDPATRTPGAVAAKNAAMRAYKAALRSFLKEFINFNSTVTVEDRRNMGLPIYKTGKTPAPVPSAPPQANIRIPSPGVVEIHYRSAESARERKPAGVYGCEIKWKISDSMVDSWAQLVHSEFDTCSPLRLSFDGPDRGRRLWFALRWENTRGDKGPWSEIQEARIP